MNSQLATKPAEQLALTPEIPLSVESKNLPIAKLIEGVLQNPNLGTEAVGVIERLTALFERQQAREAEREFAQAFSQLQAEMPRVFATKIVPDRNGGVRFKFAPYEEIMEAVRPMLLKHGFTVTFSMDYKDGRIIQTCTLQHTGGHSRSNNFAVRIGSGPPGSSEAQADGAASTYAKRFALCAALNITVEQDTDAAKKDASMEGACIADDKVQYLRELVKETKSDEARFLQFAQASKYEEIREAHYERLVASLHRKQGIKQ